MYYINTQGPNHGNPISTPFPNSVSLPDTLLTDYINTKGFCTLTVQDGAVTALVVDQEALDAYNAEQHPGLAGLGVGGLHANFACIQHCHHFHVSFQ